MSDNRIILPGQEQQQQQQHPLGQMMQQVQVLGSFLKQMDQALFNVSQEVQAQGLGYQMVLNMFIDKGIFTQEEVDELHKKHVIEPIEESMKELQQKMQEAQNVAAQQQQTIAKAQEEENKEPEEEVVLASEKTSNVVKFPNVQD